MIQIDNNFRREACPFCYSKKIKFKGKINYPRNLFFTSHPIDLKNNAELYQCSACQSQFVQNAIPPTIAQELYNKGGVESSYAYASFKAEKDPDLLNFLDPYLKAGKSILDVGCGTGEFLDYAKEKGCVTFGVEINEKARTILAGKGHEYFGSITEAGEKYDLITLFDVAEHIYDLPEFLDAIATKLSPSGHLILFLGDIHSMPAKLAGNSWWHYGYPEHISFPSVKFLTAIKKLKLGRTFALFGSKSDKEKSSLKNFPVGKFFGSTYTGYPSFAPDHIVVELHRS